MEKIIREVVLKRKSNLERLLKPAEQRLSKSPEGSLRISRDKGRVQYYWRTDPEDHNGTYLPQKEQALIRGLAQKDYDQRFIKSIWKELRAIDRFLKCGSDVDPEDVFAGMPEERRKLVIPEIETEEMYTESWLAVTYQGKPFSGDLPELLTDRGERVRSKSEVIIANLLDKEDIPYRYEYPFKLDGAGIIYPDFTVLNVRLRKEMIWEHQGMMDDPEYAEQAVRKTRSYYRSGIFPGDRLIITSETRMNPIDTKELKLIIDRYLK